MTASSEEMLGSIFFPYLKHFGVFIHGYDMAMKKKRRGISRVEKGETGSEAVG